jgi:hypothetical protein
MNDFYLLTDTGAIPAATLDELAGHLADRFDTDPDARVVAMRELTELERDALAGLVLNKLAAG